MSADSKFICAIAGFSMQQSVTVADTTRRPVGQSAVPIRDMMSIAPGLYAAPEYSLVQIDISGFG
ncbi:hypothetical protein [Nocardia jinanensis]|uniref:Uncharacterized protein n=1 Tax=Nocardia jinanensis TaxID=382504 RepID=A0A917VTV2_9NOCA|nr:hypothetical protein [Nocardia jinanensis]GGL17227.1 hypothetical protein GCM10011588_34870 [Nocardia jinanensis]